MKKIFALVLALVMALCAMSVSVFAETITLFNNPDGDTLKADGTYTYPWDGFGIGSVAVNDKAYGELSIDEIKTITLEGGAKVVMEFACASFATWQTESPELQFNNWDNEEALQVNAELTDLGDGKWMAVWSLDDCYANLTNAGLTIDDVRCLGVQLWADQFVLYSVKIVTGDDANIEAPAVDEAPAEDVEAPAEDVEAPAVDEAPAEDTTVEDAPAADEAPAETGLALAIVPMIIAAAAVVLSKKN